MNKEQHKSPCKECPWRRVSMRGWLANEPPGVWLVRAHGEFVVPCHLHAKVQCAGMAIYRGNVGKSPRSPDILVLDPDTKRVFATPMEFEEHHTLFPTKKTKKQIALEQLQHMEQAHRDSATEIYEPQSSEPKSPG